MHRCSRSRARSGSSRLAVLACTLALLVIPPVHAQDDESQLTQARPLTEADVVELDTLREALPEQREKIADLERRVAAAEGPAGDILSLRLDLAWLRLLEDTLNFATAVADLRDRGFDIGDYSGDASAALESTYEVAQTTTERAGNSVNLPTPDMSPTEQAVAYARVFEALDTINRVYGAFSRSIEISRSFGLDVARSEQAIRTGIGDRAINTSVFLEMTLRDINALRAAQSIAPDDATIKAALAEAEKRLESAARELERIANRMDELGLDTTEYRAQVLSATGEITADLFNLDVIADLLADWWSNITGVIATAGPGLLFKILLFLIIVYIARKVAVVVEMLVKRALAPDRVRISRLLENMIVSTAGNIVLLIGILIGLAQLGISIGPLLAGLGIAGFIIGFALQDTLSNFASGMMILFYRPFDVGDLIESNGVLGKVSHMSLVNTTILTIDNQTIVLPNNLIWQNMIKNVTGQNLRRVDLVFGVSYGDEIPKVESILKEIVAAHDKILDDPEPQIHLHELADSSVNFIVRPWVETDDYWDVYWDLMRTVKMRFDEEGITIPFPQRDVHHFQATAEAPGSAD